MLTALICGLCGMLLLVFEVNAAETGIVPRLLRVEKTGNKDFVFDGETSWFLIGLNNEQSERLTRYLSLYFASKK